MTYPVYLALGSNLGDRAENLARLRQELARAGFEVTRASTVRETEPFGVTDQPRFLNQVVEGRWEGSARELLDAAKAAEARTGRTPGPRWGPRVADADIVLFGDEVIAEPGLNVPHPGLAERRFVLEPLAELAPDLAHPQTGATVAAMLSVVLKG